MKAAKDMSFVMAPSFYEQNTLLKKMIVVDATINLKYSSRKHERIIIGKSYIFIFFPQEN